ncbi:hypothetical protein LLEC1_01904, partial [Akanthomyces lecanii]
PAGTGNRWRQTLRLRLGARQLDGKLLAAQLTTAAPVCLMLTRLRRKYIDRIRKVAGPYTDPDAISEPSLQMFSSFKVLVIGAGGLGCEILKNLAMSQFKDIHGFKGQARVVLPTITSCIECQLDMHAPRAAVPLCTIASIPRQPEHCVEWAHVIAWDQDKPFAQLDKDDPAHVTWLYQKALARAREFGIAGVTYALTQGTIKNIIPAIASTNAIVAAACCNEAFKIATTAAPCLGFESNYMMYSGNDGIYTYTFKHEKKDDCPVCGNEARPLDVDPRLPLQDLLDSFAVRPEAQLKRPSIRAEGKTLYMQFPEGLERQTRPNLEKTIAELGLVNGQQVVVTDPAYPLEFNFFLKFTA